MTQSNPVILKAPTGIRILRDRAGLLVSGETGLLEITGKDAVTFLHNQLPLDIDALPPGEGGYTAYLDAKGRITHDLILLRLEDRFWALAPADRLASLAEKLERYRIREDVVAEEITPKWIVLELHGPSVPAVLARSGGDRVQLEPFHHLQLTLAGHPVRFVSDPWTGDVGGHLISPRPHAEAVEQALLEAGSEEGLVWVEPDALEILRIEGGRPRFGVDMDERTLLPELDREDMASAEKGCYLGQETVARIRSRGRVNRLLRGLVIEGNRVPEPGTLVQMDDAPVGETRSAGFSPSRDRVLALAMLRRQAAEPGSVVHLHFGDRWVAARVEEVPLYRPPGPAEMAEQLHARGLTAFKQDRLPDALALFEKAVLLNPRHLGAFESAGICLERMGRVDEAMERMQALIDSDPENVMAWTNLSRYHAQQGRIEEAEKVKGHVTYLLWKKDLSQRETEEKAQTEKAKRRARLEERIALFQQVLELDPEDVVASFGLGKVLLDLDRLEQAVPHFQKAIERKADYSMAYNHLGTCLARLGRDEEARAVLEQGIEVAGRKGDFLPKRDMTRKLGELTGSGSSGKEG